jgi:hypothetical protein
MTKLSAVNAVAQPYLQVVSGGRDDVPEVGEQAIQDALQRLGSRGNELYRGSLGEDEDRSSRLYELAALASEHGVDEETTYGILSSCAYNKFSGRDDEALRIWEAVERSRDSELPTSSRKRNLRSSSISTLLSRDIRPAQWAVEGIWGHQQYGFIAGEPKTFKSTISTDFAISIATATPFLEHFPVLHSGPVIIVQEENTEDIQHARFSKILRERELAGKIHSYSGSVLELTPPSNCPVYSFDRTGFSFNSGRQRQRLEREIAILRPSFVIFDPLQMMTGGLSLRDEGDVAQIFRWLNKINKTYKCGIIVVHHYHKRREEGPQLGGQRMLGSQALHAWLMCGLYMQKGIEGLKVSREFRAFPESPPFEIEFDFEDDEDVYRMKVHEQPTKVKTHKQDEMLDLLMEHPWKTAAEYAEICGKSRRAVGEMLERMDCQKKKKKLKGNAGGRPKIVFGPPAKTPAK